LLRVITKVPVILETLGPPKVHHKIPILAYYLLLTLKPDFHATNPHLYLIAQSQITAIQTHYHWSSLITGFLPQTINIYTLSTQHISWIHATD